MRYVIDTNVLLDSPDVIEQYLQKGVVSIPHVILEELDKHKEERDTPRAYAARRAVRVLKEFEMQIEWDFDFKSQSGYKNDDVILSYAYTLSEDEEGCTVVTNDYLMQLKVLATQTRYPKIKYDYIQDQKTSEYYTGYKEIYLNEIQLADLYQNMSRNSFNLLVNEYLVIYDNNKLLTDILRWTGDKLVSLSLPKIKGLKHKNPLQACALDLLNNTDIPIKIIAGTYGSGKTLLNVKSALHQVVDKGNYSKILMIRNPIGSGEQIGFLGGDKEAKTQDFFKPFIQHVDGGEQTVSILEQRGTLAKEIPFYIKGLSIDNTFIICDEAEDLNTQIIKLIGTRLGENSCIAFSGDYNQSEKKYINDNGLTNAINLLKGNPLVGIIVLQDDVRSLASKVFADLM